MLLTIGLILATITTFTEIKLVHGSKIISRLYTQGFGKVEGIWFNTAGSFALSYLIGMLFGAEGVTVMLGGALSTGMSQGYFSVEEWIQLNRGYPTVAKYLKSLRVSFGKSMSGTSVLFADTWRLLKFTLKVVTFPFWGYRGCKEWFNNQLHHTST